MVTSLRGKPEAGRQSLLIVLALAGMLATALAAVALVVRWPLAVAVALAAVLIVGLIVRRLDVATAVLAAGFFFNDYLARGVGILTIDKAIGGLAVAAWALDWVLNKRAVVTSRGLWLIAGFLLWNAVSFVFARDDTTALVTSLRYVTFATLYFLVLQTVRGNLKRAGVLVTVVVIAAALASFIGLVAFFSNHVQRASGPIGDPNDFGFILGSSLPLAMYQVRWAGNRWGRVFSTIALVLILGCTIATFSRSALTGLAVAGAWAVATRRLRFRWLLGTIAIMAVAVAGALFLAPQLVQTAFGQKAHVATANIDIRLGYYRVELNEWRHYPVAGVGPGNFVHRFYQFAPSAGESLPFPSNVLTISGEEAYLVILAEQGAIGLALFLGYLIISWADLRRRYPNDRQRDQLQAAMAAGFVVACVGALFLAEQYYPPLWFLPAMGASMAVRR